VFFLYERNCRLRKKLLSERKVNDFVLKRNRQLEKAVSGYKSQETDLRGIIRFQEEVIKDFAPEHSDDRPVVDFPIRFTFDEPTCREENVKLGNSTII